MLLRSKNPDPFQLGKHKKYTRHLWVTAWFCLILSFAIGLDSLGTQKLTNQTVLELEEDIRYVRSGGGKYGGGTSRPVSYFKLRTRSLNLALNVYITETLALQPGDALEYWRTPLFHQRLLIAANGIAFTYQTFAERYFYFLLANALLALIGLLPFIPGQIRVTTITISGLFSFFFIMLLL